MAIVKMSAVRWNGQSIAQVALSAAMFIIAKLGDLQSTSLTRNNPGSAKKLSDGSWETTAFDGGRLFSVLDVICARFGDELRAWAVRDDLLSYLLSELGSSTTIGIRLVAESVDEDGKVISELLPRGMTVEEARQARYEEEFAAQKATGSTDAEAKALAREASSADEYRLNVSFLDLTKYREAKKTARGPVQAVPDSL